MVCGMTARFCPSPPDATLKTTSLLKDEYQQEEKPMKKQLAVLAMLALVGSFAKADDKGTEFKFGGEVMQRFENTQDANLASGSAGSVGTDWLMRNQFHVN